MPVVHIISTLDFTSFSEPLVHIELLPGFTYPDNHCLYPRLPSVFHKTPACPRGDFVSALGRDLTHQTILTGPLSASTHVLCHCFLSSAVTHSRELGQMVRRLALPRALLDGPATARSCCPIDGLFH